MLSLQNILYIHPNKDLLFSNIDLAVNKHEKLALIGNNGTGKSTLLKIIAGEIQATSGHIAVDPLPYYIPQVFGQYNHLNIAQALNIEEKLKALKEILGGNASEDHFNVLNDDWNLEDRCKEALRYWDLDGIDLSEKMERLSGGEKTRVFLAGIQIHEPELVLLDEPSNHLDLSGRKLLHDFIRTTESTLLVVSHDRKLLNLMDKICELTKREIIAYGGNYDFYKEQKQIQSEALKQGVHDKEKTLRKAREKERETLERRQKLDNRGKDKQEKAGMARIMMNTLRNKAENSTSKLKNVHIEKINGISNELQQLRNSLPEINKMKFGFDNSSLHKGKVLFRAMSVNFQYRDKPLWKEDLNFEITSGERLVIKGANGSGKTTLVNLILSDIHPTKGTFYRVDCKSIYLDQDYSLVDNALSIYDQAQKFNLGLLQENEIKTRLHRFLFTKEHWDKLCSSLSGGERLRLILCCLNITNKAPDVLILDEPTNNLDLQNIEILTAALNEYRGILIVVSHDETFLEQVKIERVIDLK